MHRHVAAALIFFAWGARPLHAFSGRAVTLWQLVAQSPRIVVADVTALRPADDLGAELIADLRIDETWKGPEAERVGIRFSSHSCASLCCATGYAVGQRLLVFLHSRVHTDSDVWWTTGVGFGAILVNDEDLAVYRARVNEALKLQAQGARYEAPTDWLIRCATRRATRWHGVYDLQFRSLSRSIDLRASERSAIGKGFVAEPAADVALPLVLGLVGKTSVPGLYSTANAQVEPLLDAAPPWLEEALGYLRNHVHDRPLRARLQERWRQLHSERGNRVPFGAWINGRRGELPGICGLWVVPPQ